MNDGIYYDSDGFSAISADTLAKMQPGGVDPDVHKFGFRSSGSDDWPSTLKLSRAARGNNGGVDQLLLGLDIATLSPPFGLTISVSASGAGGAWGAPGQYAYVVTALNAAGETAASFEVVAVVGNTTQVVTFGWVTPPGLVTGCKVYRRSFPGGTYASPSLVGTVSAGTTTLVDNGAAAGVGTPPLANTTGGPGPAYGTPPAFGPGPLNPGALAYGQMVFFWVKRVPAASLGLQTYNAAIEATP